MTLYRFAFRAMASDCELQFYAETDQAASAAAKKAIDDVRRIEHKYSRYVEDSVVSQINRQAGTWSIDVDAETAALLNYAQTCHQASGGLFDITSGVLRKVWNFRAHVPPQARAIAEVLPLIGWDQVQWDGATVRLPRAGMEIDFGGIGKEYAADRAANILQTEGVDGGFVNLGGDIRVLGPHPDGAPWSIGICHPRVSAGVAATVSLVNGALATSGDYERFFEYAGRRYCHILNPRTGQPVSHWQSVSVIAPLCVTAGTASTVAMLLGEDAAEFLADQALSFVAIDQSGRIHRNIDA